MRTQAQRKTYWPEMRTSQGLSTLRSEPGRAPGRNVWAKQQLGPWPGSRERRARGFPPAPCVIRDRRPLGFLPRVPRLLTPPRPSRWTGSLPRRAHGRGEPAEAEAGGSPAAGASAQAPSWNPLQARISTCGGRRGKAGILGFRTARLGGEGLGTRAAPRNPARSCAQLATRLPGPVH